MGRQGEAETTPIRVECYAGYRDEETPRRVHFDDRTLEVERVLDTWMSPEYRYFELRAEDGRIYLIRHNMYDDFWELAVFR